MRAILSRTVGGPESLELAEIATPVPEAGEVLIAVKAVGINFPDTLMIEDRYQFKPPRPFAPGGEVAGIVEALGQGVSDLQVGDCVIAMPGWGGLVERLAVQADRLVKIPRSIPFIEAAALSMTYGTVFYALKERAQLKAGETLFVLGAAGGIGSAAVEIGKALGATVVAAASTPEKVEFAIALGADHGLVYPVGPMDKVAQKSLAAQIKLACGRDGPDVVLDGVGGDYSEPAIRAMDWNGRFLVVGFPAGIPRLPLNLTLLKSVAVIGVFFGAHIDREPDLHRRNFNDLIQLHVAGKVRPRISRTFAFEEAAEAIKALAKRSAVGKMVVEVGN